MFDLSPYGRKRNEEVDNTNLPLSRTEHHIPPSPIQNQENYEKSMKPHPIYLENKNQEASFLNSYEGTRSRTKQIYKFKSDLLSRYSAEIEEENENLKELMSLINNLTDSSNGEKMARL